MEPEIRVYHGLSDPRARFSTTTVNASAMMNDCIKVIVVAEGPIAGF